jgi:hypothetical protein
LIVLANEFFDALPVHQFEHTERGWHEKMVDLDTSDGPNPFRLVLSPSPNVGHFVPKVLLSPLQSLSFLSLKPYSHQALFPHPPFGHPNEHQVEVRICFTRTYEKYFHDK